MQNIDPIYVLQPLIITILTFALVFYAARKRTLTRWVLAYSLAAYAVAIGAKTVLQALTYQYVLATGSLPLIGIYFGLQTVFLEVGLAYLFARYAVSKRQFGADQAEAYGIGLAFWENGVLLGVLSLVSVSYLYFAIGSGSPAAVAIYNATIAAEPSLFYPASQAVIPALMGVLERLSSIILHFAWGYLVVLAAVTRKRQYLYCALPMGLADFFVPFASLTPIYVFEVLLFAFSLVCLGAAVMAMKERAAQGK